jgi:prevent-host-death family protein
MKTMAPALFKAQCLAVMDEVQAKRETVVITKHGKAVAKLIPADEDNLCAAHARALRSCVLSRGGARGLAKCQHMAKVFFCAGKFLNQTQPCRNLNDWVFWAGHEFRRVVVNPRVKATSSKDAQSGRDNHQPGWAFRDVSEIYR